MDEVIALEATQDRWRSTMRALAHRPMTANEFLYAYDGVEGRWELVEGEPVMMAGGTFQHAAIATNLIAAIVPKLRGTGCRAFGSDALVDVNLYNQRLPDVSIYCDPRDTGTNQNQKRSGQFPKVIFEVLSRSTQGVDRGRKLAQYKALPSVAAIVLIDPETETIDLAERIGTNDWRERVLAKGAELELPAIGLVLSAQDIFRDD